MQWPLVPYASREPLGVGEKRRMRWVFEPTGLASAGGGDDRGAVGGGGVVIREGSTV